MSPEEAERWGRVAELAAEHGLTEWLEHQLVVNMDSEVPTWAGAVCLGYMRPEDFIQKCLETRGLS